MQRKKQGVLLHKEQLTFLIPGKEGNGISPSKSQKRPDSTDTTGSFTDSKVLQLEVNGIGPPGMMDCMFSDKVVF